jgi:TolB protein
MNVDGRNLQNLTNTNHEANDFWPAWSPDGKHLAFVSNRDRWMHKIFVVDMDGKNLHRLIDQPFEQFNPCWSLDGRVIYGIPQDKMYIMQQDGKGVEEFVNIQDECWFRWSPDHRWIIWADLYQPPNWEVYLTNARTGTVKNLTEDSAEDRSPSWLP